MEKATFAAGCFWGVEFNFDKIEGVISSKVGYAGGHTDAPTYEAICRGDTGHAEVIEIMFNPDQVSYGELIDALWHLHDPTTLNSQGPDFGTQYRSAIFYHDENQKIQAEDSKSALDKSGQWPNPVVTEITAAPKFFDAEDYHQKYMKKRGLTITCGG